MCRRLVWFVIGGPQSRAPNPEKSSTPQQKIITRSRAIILQVVSVTVTLQRKHCTYCIEFSAFSDRDWYRLQFTGKPLATSSHAILNAI